MKLLLLACLALVACGGSPPSSSFGHNRAPQSADATNEGQFGGDQETTPGAATNAGGAVSEVWSHSANTLFKLDPTTKQVSVVGQFSGCTGAVVDIALDEKSTLFATTEDGLFTVDRGSAQCTLVARGTYPNSLSFVPRGTVDANVEALVGYLDADYVRIDTTSGAVTRIGALGSGDLRSSGDIVSVKDGPTYLTVNGTGCNDCLVEVNPKTGALVKNWGPLAHGEVYGIAFWAGSVYAFDAEGALFELTFAGGTLATKDIAIPNAQAGLQFYGAGSTTSAPVSPTR